MDDENVVQPKDQSEWREWLDANHKNSSGIWLIIYKKSSGKQVFSFDDAIEDALCYGWIDSKPGKVDDERTKLWFAPRKSKTGWSKLNKDRVERLVAAGRMMPAGQAKIDGAKGDGSWSLLDSVEALEIPDDLAAKFDAYPGARENFEAFPRSVRRGILEWIVQAKRADTRNKRIDETARLAAENKRANQWAKK